MTPDASHLQQESSDPTDAVLLQRISRGETAALSALLGRYRTRIYGMSVRMLHNTHDAEEVLQDVALTLFRKAGAFRGEAAVSSWIYRITMNACLMTLRRRPKVPMLPLAEELGPAMNDEGMTVEPIADWTPGPRDEAARGELAAQIRAAADRLPPEYRMVFVLRDVKGLSAEEACVVSGLSLPALKSRLHRARLFLRKQLADAMAEHAPRRSDVPVS